MLSQMKVYEICNDMIRAFENNGTDGLDKVCAIYMRTLHGGDYDEVLRELYRCIPDLSWYYTYRTRR